MINFTCTEITYNYTIKIPYGVTVAREVRVDDRS